MVSLALAAGAQARPVIDYFSAGFHQGELRGAVYAEQGGGFSAGRRDSAGVGVFGSTPRMFRTTIYQTRRAVVDGTRIRAKFGTKENPWAQGGMRMRFHRRSTDVDKDSCIVERKERGFLRGRVVFRGEDDYVSVSETRLPAFRYRVSIREKCLAPAPQAGRARPRPVVLAACYDHGGYFAARSSRRNTAVEAGGRSTRPGAMPSWTYIVEEVSPSRFDYAPDFSSATVDPPAPFAGTGTFSAASGRLTGDLSWRALNGKRVDVADADAALGEGDRVSCRSRSLAGPASNAPPAAGATSVTAGVPDFLRPWIPAADLLPSG